MFILYQWSVLNMHDWVSEAVAVSVNKAALKAYSHKQGLRSVSCPLIDTTEGESLGAWCVGRGWTENCISHYFTIEKIECV